MSFSKAAFFFFFKLDSGIIITSEDGFSHLEKMKT